MTAIFRLPIKSMDPVPLAEESGFPCRICDDEIHAQDSPVQCCKCKYRIHRKCCKVTRCFCEEEEDAMMCKKCADRADHCIQCGVPVCDACADELECEFCYEIVCIGCHDPCDSCSLGGCPNVECTDSTLAHNIKCADCGYKFCKDSMSRCGNCEANLCEECGGVNSDSELCRECRQG